MLEDLIAAYIKPSTLTFFMILPQSAQSRPASNSFQPNCVVCFDFVVACGRLVWDD